VNTEQPSSTSCSARPLRRVHDGTFAHFRNQGTSMRIGILGSMMALLAVVGPVLAQTPDGASAPAGATPGSSITAPTPPVSLPPGITPAGYAGAMPCGPGGCAAGEPCVPRPLDGQLPEFRFGPCPLGNCLYGSAEYIL